MESSCAACAGTPRTRARSGATRAGLGGLVLSSGALALLVPKCPWCVLAYASLLGAALDPLVAVLVLGIALPCALLLARAWARARAAQETARPRAPAG